MDAPPALASSRRFHGLPNAAFVSLHSTPGISRRSRLTVSPKPGNGPRCTGSASAVTVPSPDGSSAGDSAGTDASAGSVAETAASPVLLSSIAAALWAIEPDWESVAKRLEWTKRWLFREI